LPFKPLSKYSLDDDNDDDEMGKGVRGNED
jgi:hypothetical protein